MLSARAGLIALLFSLSFSTYASNSLLASFYAPVALAMGVHPNVVGAIFAVCPLFSCLSSVLLGSRVKQLGRFALLLGGSLVFVACLGGFASLQIFIPPSATDFRSNTSSTCSNQSFTRTTLNQQSTFTQSAFTQTTLNQQSNSQPAIKSKSNEPSTASLGAFIGLSFLMRALQGVGMAVIGLVCSSYVMLLYPKQIGLFTGLWEFVIGLAYALGSTLGGLLFELGGWLTPFLCLAAMTLLSAVPILAWVRSPRLAQLEVEDTGDRATSMKSPLLTDDSRVFNDVDDDDDDDDDDETTAEAWRFEHLPDISVGRLLTVPRVVVIAAVLVAYMMLYTFQDPVLPPALIDPCGPYRLTSAVQIGLVFLAASGTYSLLAPLAGAASDRCTAARPAQIFVSTILAGVSLLFMGPAAWLQAALPPSLTLVLVAEFVTGLAGAVALVVCWSIAIDHMKATHKHVNSVNTINGVFAAASSIGEIIGPLVASPLSIALGFGNTAAVIGLLVIAVALLFAVVYFVQPLVSKLFPASNLSTVH